MKNKNQLLALLIVLLMLTLLLGISWAVVVSIFKLIAICFGGTFSLAWVTLAWFGLLQLLLIFRPGKKEK